MARKIYQFSKKGEFISQHKSITKASKVMGCDESTIRKAVDRHRFAMGFAWRSSNDYNDILKIKKNLPKILVFDIETAPLRAYIWQKEVWKANVGSDKVISEWFMLTWSARWLFGKETMSMRITGREAIKENDSRIVKELWKLLHEADIVIAHNGKKFDVPNINTRFLLNGLPPCRPYQQIDTKYVAAKQFGFTHNSLNGLAKLFGFPAKLDTDFSLWEKCVLGDDEALKYMEEYNRYDVELLEEVYLKLRPWIKGHPNLGLYMELDEPVCTNCGSTELTQDGYTYTGVARYPTVRCKCGSYGRLRKNDFDPEKRKHLIAPLRY